MSHPSKEKLWLKLLKPNGNLSGSPEVVLICLPIEVRLIELCQAEFLQEINAFLSYLLEYF